MTACVPPAQPSYFGPQPSLPPATTASEAPAFEPSAQPEAVAGATTAEPAGVAVTFAMPPGFAERSGWYIAQNYNKDWSGETFTSGLVGVLPAVPAAGDLGTAARTAWATYVPPEIRASESRMVFRRRVGDGLIAHFVHGRGLEVNKKLESWFAMYVVDCGSRWQPVLVAATYEEVPSRVGSIMNIKVELPIAVAKAEPLLAALRCDGPKQQPIIAASSIAGHYYFGSGASQDYINVYTGAPSTQFVSYSGEYDLRADGTVSYLYSSASDRGTGTTFAGDKASGRWSVTDDLLVLELAGRAVKRMRIASITQFSDAKLMVVLGENQPTTPLTVENGQVLTTKRRD